MAGGLVIQTTSTPLRLTVRVEQLTVNAKSDPLSPHKILYSEGVTYSAPPVFEISKALFSQASADSDLSLAFEKFLEADLAQGQDTYQSTDVLKALESFANTDSNLNVIDTDRVVAPNSASAQEGQRYTGFGKALDDQVRTLSTLDYTIFVFRDFGRVTEEGVLEDSVAFDDYVTLADSLTIELI